MTTEPPEPYGVSGKPIVLFFAAVAILATVIVVAYKIEEAKLPPARMDFTKSSNAAAAAANATVVPLNDLKVHSATADMDAWLDEAAYAGSSEATSRPAVERYHDYLLSVAPAATSPTFVDWKGDVIRIAWSGV